MENTILRYINHFLYNAYYQARLKASVSARSPKLIDDDSVWYFDGWPLK